MHLPAIIALTGFGLIVGSLCLYVALACAGGDPQMDGEGRAEAIDLETLEGRRAAFDRWSAAQKRKQGPFAGLGFARTNTGGWSFGRHWPHLLCWSWSLYLEPYRGVKYDGPKRFHAFWLGYGNGGGQAAVTLWFFTVRLAWQEYGQMAALGPRGHGAPLIHPRQRADA